MFTCVDHVAFAVPSVEDAAAFYKQNFQVEDWEIIDMPDRHMRVAVTHLDGTLLEFIAPTSEEAAFAKYLAEKGPGMHHVAYRVDDIRAALASLKQQGLRLIDEEPRVGLHNTLVAFVHPKAAMGTLIELVQHQ